MPPRKTVTNALTVLVAALLGGVAALGGAAALGKLDNETRTVISQSAEPAVARSSTAFSVHEIYRRSAPGVVQVISTSVAPGQGDPFFGEPFNQPQSQQALGSGFVIDKQGHIVTNFHVVEGAREVQVRFGENDSHKATVVGVDRSTDLAVLKVDVDPDALTPLALGNSDAVQVGDGVVAIGSPFGLVRTATAGIVSALNRPLSAPNSFTINDVIQTDAQINHGNSGGPLLSGKAQVVGVNTAIESGGTGGNVGIGFAVPANTVKSVVAQIIKTGKVEHAWLGVQAHRLNPALVRLLHLPVSKGLLVEQVFAGSAAKKAGLKGGKSSLTIAGESYLVGGDIIVAFDGEEVGNSIERLRDAVANHEPGDEVTLEIYRSGDKKTVTVKLGEQPSRPPAG